MTGSDQSETQVWQYRYTVLSGICAAIAAVTLLGAYLIVEVVGPEPISLGFYAASLIALFGAFYALYRAYGGKRRLPGDFDV